MLAALSYSFFLSGYLFYHFARQEARFLFNENKHCTGFHNAWDTHVILAKPIKAANDLGCV